MPARFNGGASGGLPHDPLVLDSKFFQGLDDVIVRRLRAAEVKIIRMLGFEVAGEDLPLIRGAPMACYARPACRMACRGIPAGVAAQFVRLA